LTIPRIVTIGDLTADLLMPVRLPVEAGHSQEMAWHSVEPGAAGNFLIAGQRLSAQLYALGAVGDDLYGHHALKILSSEGVNVEGVAVEPTISTTVVAVLFEPDAGKFSYVWHGGHGEPIPVSETAIRIIEQADALFMQGFTLCEASLRPLVDYALGSSRPIWFDVGPATNDLAEKDRVKMRQRAYAIMTTEDELPLIASGKTGQVACDLILQDGPHMVVIKRGDQGCRVGTHTEQIDVPAFTVKVRDLVGAGDCFNAAFMVAMLQGLPLAESGKLANAAGAAKIQKLGTGRAMPTRIEIEAVLDSAGVTINF